MRIGRWSRLLVLFALVLQSQPVLATPLCLWKIESASSVVYLLGSIHALPDDFYPLPKSIDSAFEAADTLVVEVDITALSQAEINRIVTERGYYPQNQSLSSTLKPQTLSLLKLHLGVDAIGGAMDRMRPWLVAVQLSLQELQHLGYLPENGIDQHYLHLAHAAGKRVQSLETLQQQVDLLAGETPEVQELSLAVSLSEMGQLGAAVDELVAAWRLGDADEMHRLAMVSLAGHPALTEQMRRIIDDRNLSMAAGIRDYLASRGTYLVIVGALHLGGDKGLVQLLKDGFEVHQFER